MARLALKANFRCFQQPLMENSIEIPDTVPVMTLPETVLFPKAMLPLYIFEERYKQMVSDTLKGLRVFAVAGLERSREQTEHEPYYDTAAVGLIRACHENEDGTSNLVLQGLTRVRIKRVMFEEPYRVAKIEVLESDKGDEPSALECLRSSLTGAIQLSRDLGSPIPDHVMEFLEKIEEAETFLDISAFTLCKNVDEKQQLLETLDTSERFRLFIDLMRIENDRLQLLSQLKGGLTDEDIELN